MDGGDVVLEGGDLAGGFVGENLDELQVTVTMYKLPMRFPRIISCGEGPGAYTDMYLSVNFTVKPAWVIHPTLIRLKGASGTCNAFCKVMLKACLPKWLATVAVPLPIDGVLPKPLTV